MVGSLSGRFSRTTLRITIATSTSDRWMFRVNRPFNRVSLGVELSAACPVPTTMSLPSNRLLIASTTSCTT